MADGTGSGAGVGAQPHLPAQALRVRESAWFAAPADTAWQLVRELDLALLMPGAVRSCVVEDGPAARVGSLRAVTRKDGGVWRYRVTELSDARRQIAFDLFSVTCTEGGGDGDGGGGDGDGNPSSGNPNGGCGADTTASVPYTASESEVRVFSITEGGGLGCMVEWITVFSSDAPPSTIASTRATKLKAFSKLREVLTQRQFERNVASLSTTSLPKACNHVMMGDQFPVEQCVAQYLERGGKLVVLDPEDASHGQFLIAPTDYLYPVCSSGQNRSQVLREVLLRRTKNTTFSGRVMLAHAALAGVDPYVDDMMSATVSTRDIDASDSGFQDAFGHPRDPRIGEDEFPFGGFHEPYSPFLTRAKGWFSTNVYGRLPSTPADGRRVYVCFEKPTHGVLKRLVESNTSLDDVVVVSIPVGDVIAHPPEGIARNSADAMWAAYRSFEGLLDFSALSTVESE